MSDEIEKLRTHVRVLNEELQKHHGTVAALGGALLTLVETHPNPALFLQKLAVNLEPTEALLLGSSQSEVGLESFQVARARLTDSCQIALARQALGE